VVGDSGLAEARPWHAGERLRFEVDVRGARAGDASLTVVAAGGAGSVEVGLDARQTSLGRATFQARSRLRAGSLRPGPFHDEQDGWGGRRSTEAVLDRSPNAVRVAWQAGGRTGMNAYLRGPAVLDFASAVPYLRAASLAPGARFCFDAVGATSYWRVDGRVGPGTERVATPAGRFEAVRLDATLRRADGGGTPVALRLWIATGAMRLPVAAEAETALGTVRARLAAFTPGQPAR